MIVNQNYKLIIKSHVLFHGFAYVIIEVHTNVINVKVTLFVNFSRLTAKQIKIWQRQIASWVRT